MADSGAAIVCLTTVSGSTEARTIARALVGEHLAACVNELPVHSTYRWKGTVESAEERLLVIKTAAANWERLCERIHALSSYEVPEIIALDPLEIDAEYAAWLLAESGGGS